MKHIMSSSSKSKLTNVSEVDVQPNAVDLRLGKVFAIDCNIFILDNEKKTHRGTKELKPDADGYYFLVPGAYEVVLDNQITVGENEAGWVITRSTLIRNGLSITSGLYDSGYNGSMVCALHVTSGPAKIKKGTRIGQYLSFDSESLHMYDGDYGTGKEHDKKYQ